VAHEQINTVICCVSMTQPLSTV